MYFSGLTAFPQQYSATLNTSVCLQATYLSVDIHKICLILKDVSCDLLLHVACLVPSPT